MLSTISADEYEYSSKTRQIYRGAKSVTRAATLLNTEKDIFTEKDREGAIGYRKGRLYVAYCCI